MLVGVEARVLRRDEKREDLLMIQGYCRLHNTSQSVQERSNLSELMIGCGVADGKETFGPKKLCTLDAKS